jgi:hypothetical protein
MPCNQCHVADENGSFSATKPQNQRRLFVLVLVPDPDAFSPSRNITVDIHPSLSILRELAISIWVFGIPSSISHKLGPVAAGLYSRRRPAATSQHSAAVSETQRGPSVVTWRRPRISWSFPLSAHSPFPIITVFITTHDATHPGVSPDTWQTADLLPILSGRFLLDPRFATMAHPPPRSITSHQPGRLADVLPPRCIPLAQPLHVSAQRGRYILPIPMEAVHITAEHERMGRQCDAPPAG